MSQFSARSKDFVKDNANPGFGSHRKKSEKLKIMSIKDILKER